MLKYSIFLLILSFSAWSGCKDILSKSHTVNARVFEFSESDLVLEDSWSKNLLSHLLLDELSCDEAEFKYNRENLNCLDAKSTSICEYQDPKLGYFVIVTGSFGHYEYRIIWSRWD